MNRRDFLRRLGGAAAAIALTPLLDLAPIEPARSIPAFSGHPLTLKILQDFADSAANYQHQPHVLRGYPRVIAAYRQLLEADRRSFR